MDSFFYLQLILPLKLCWEPWYSSASELSAGQRVSVRFAGRQYVAVVHRTATEPGIPVEKVQAIESVLDDLAPVSHGELRMWEFMSSYYLCSIGEVYKAAYPSAKTRSETDAVLTVKRLEALIDIKLKLIAGLESKKKPNLKLIEQHKEILARHRRMLESLSVPGGADDEPGHFTRTVPLLSVRPDNMSLYIEAIRQVISNGDSSLILVPQTSASDNMYSRLSAEFGSILVACNSTVQASRRRDLLHRLRYSTEPLVVLGTRSSLFLPFRRLALVIVDAEQSPLYKQNEPSPRYNARDAAAMLASIHGARLIIGTPCPSMESLNNAATGKYGLEYEPVPAEVVIIDMPAEKRKRGVNGILSFKLLDTLRASGGTSLLVRGFETEEQVNSQLGTLGLDCEVMTPSAACNAGRNFDVIALLSAEVLFQSDDFRSDEKALQVLKTLASMCRCLYVQTNNASHPVFELLRSGELPYALLDERREYKLPPFTRLIDIKGSKGGLLKRVVLERGRSMASEKRKLYAQYAATNIIDVDPL